MIRWNKPVIDRDQVALFAPTLDAYLDEDHTVRVVAEILASLDFGSWESEYDAMNGQPPIHPRVVAGVILYGLSMGIRSSRRLEDACGHRLDFIWLAEGRKIDHSTFCKFRVRHHAQLKELFGQLVLTGREMGMTRLNQVIWDGTRIRANNNRCNTARQEKLGELVSQLQEQYEKMAKEADAADRHEDQLYGQESVGKPLPATLRRKHKRLEEMKRAMATLRQMDQGKEQGQTHGKSGEREEKPDSRDQQDPPDKQGPKGPQVPLADPDARVLPNKEGGFSPNYTPVLAVDGESGLILDSQVIQGRCEDEAIVPSLERVEKSLGQLPRQVLADSGFHTARNIEALECKGVQTLIPQRVSFEQNPAERDDPRAPVPASQWEQLPVNPTSKALDKAAFIYDSAGDRYHCPMGKPLEFLKVHEYQQGKHWRDYRVYQCDACADCELRARCIKGKAKLRKIYREKYDPACKRVADRLKTEEGKRDYRRRFRVERPFGIIKSAMGIRQFLLRGLKKVSTEWQWIVSAYNLRLLASKWKMAETSG